MNKQISQLAERRATLINRIAMQRTEIAHSFTPLHTPLAYADKGISAFRYISQHPALLAGIVSLVTFTSRKRWLVMLETGWMAWRILASARRNLQD